MTEFVESSANELGVARLIEFTATKARLEYFVSPATGAREEVEVPVESVRRAKLFAELRVYCFDSDRSAWRAGRLLDSDPIPGAALGIREDHYAVGFPNGQKQHIPASKLFVRWAVPISDPTDWLSAAVTETPFWHQGRTRFMRSAIEQRAAFGGLTALASASVELYRHQVGVVRRVLHDPIQRYLLADEVGLGKTIEAGIVLRQYFLDDPEAAALVVVPAHLIDQWCDELQTKFHLGNRLKKKLHVLASSSDDEIVALARQIGLLIIDEAHQTARLAYSESTRDQKCFEAVRLAAVNAARVLLLTATPLLHNEDAFLAMLHLLDPVVHRLDELDRL